jgi:hypothetical protein
MAWPDLNLPNLAGWAIPALNRLYRARTMPNRKDNDLAQSRKDA